MGALSEVKNQESVLFNAVIHCLKTVPECNPIAGLFFEVYKRHPSKNKNSPFNFPKNQSKKHPQALLSQKNKDGFKHTDESLTTY